MTPAADERAVAAPSGGAPAPVDLARLLVLTDRRACDRPLVEVVRAAVDGGARAIVLREKDLPADKRARLADEVRSVLGDGLLVLAGTALPGPALHLSADDPVPAARPAWLGRSCHNAQEVTRAAAQGCDWVTVSPVFATASKPGYGPALGLPGLVGLLPIGPPAYALGGVADPGRARECRAVGAHGVAVLGAVMRAERPERAVAALLAALEELP